MNIQQRISTSSPAQPSADYAALNAAALRNGRFLIQELFPGVRIRSLQCIRDDFIINYRDFSWENRTTGGKGTDLISSLVQAYGYSQDEAARLVAAKLALLAADSRTAQHHADALVFSIASAANVEDDEQSQSFLKVLDPNASCFTYQTFDDDRTRKNPALTRIIESPPTARDALTKLNEQGAGVFVTINETDGKGRKSENIQRVRAVWQEDDEGFDGAFPLQPSMVVETSPGHFHRYWPVADDWPADEQGRADFASVMERMVESYSCDKSAKDICRVTACPRLSASQDDHAAPRSYRAHEWAPL